DICQMTIGSGNLTTFARQTRASPQNFLRCLRCGGERRTSIAGLSSRRPSYTTWRSRLSSVQVRNLTSAHIIFPLYRYPLSVNAPPAYAVASRTIRRLRHALFALLAPARRSRAASADRQRADHCAALLQTGRSHGAFPPPRGTLRLSDWAALRFR